MATIDLNCDMGEGCGNDAELLRYVSSANIACGYHAGDSETMRRTVELAVANGVAVGAHPGYPDRDNFGRTAMNLRPGEVSRIVADQVSALIKICESLGTQLHHVKPHGALYNQAANDPELAGAVASAVREVGSDLILYGLSGSDSISAAHKIGMRTASEVFADRTYQADGTLTPRGQADALINDPQKSIAQVVQMVNSSTVTAADGQTVPIKAETICIHGDGPNAVEFARAVRDALIRGDVVIRAL